MPPKMTRRSDCCHVGDRRFVSASIKPSGCNHRVPSVPRDRREVSRFFESAIIESRFKFASVNVFGTEIAPSVPQFALKIFSLPSIPVQCVRSDLNWFFPLYEVRTRPNVIQELTEEFS